MAEPPENKDIENQQEQVENNAPPPENGGIGDDFDVSPITIEEEMRRSYLDYAMSVIVSRALPDVRDGLKPVHRRILYSMNENGYEYNKPYRKSARVVGDVIGKYHPHGDQSIYDALVRMAQDFSLRLPLLDGQGNFGSVDGDPPAAMRYTEVRMAKAAHALLRDIDRDTVDFQSNYDNSEQEPVVIPASLPNLLVNGAGGIAVGMATNVPPHNLGEVVSGCLKLIDNPELSDEELYETIPAPDFPTGGLILGRSGAKSAFATGRGSIIMRGRAQIEEIRKDRYAIIITEIPYQVNKSSMIEKIADLVRNKQIEGISDLRDESDRTGMRVVIELKRDSVPEIILNQLYRYSPLQTSFGANMLALNNGRPQLMNMRTMIECFLTFREEVITRRSRFTLNKARERAHILVGLAIAVANIDKVIKLIRSAPNPQSARKALLECDWSIGDIASLLELIDDPNAHINKDGKSCKLSEIQAKAILELRLQRLTALGRDEIDEELNQLREKIEDLLDILRNRERVLSIIRDELKEINENFANPRRTEIIESEFESDEEDLIASEDVVVTLSHSGYIKRVPLSTYRSQRRGGKGRAGMATKEEDFVTRIFIANTHDVMLFFSTTGMVYKHKVWRMPQGSPQSRGKALVNILPIQEDEGIAALMVLPSEEESWEKLHVMFATSKGSVRRNELSDFIRINRNGKIAMKPDKDESIVDVHICEPKDNVLLNTHQGRCIRFQVEKVRVFKSRNSTGVRGIKLEKNDKVISMAILSTSDASPEERTAYLKQANKARREESAEDIPDTDEEAVEEITLSPERYQQMAASEQFLLTISENGFGKRSSSYEYRISGRGGKGIIAITTTERNGPVIGSFPVKDEDQIMLVTNNGQLIRCPVKDIRIAGRNTQGVTIFRMGEEDKVVSVISIGEVEEGDDEQEELPEDVEESSVETEEIIEEEEGTEEE